MSRITLTKKANGRYYLGMDENHYYALIAACRIVLEEGRLLERNLNFHHDRINAITDQLLKGPRGAA
jgi:hypothetical protein